MKLRLIAEIQHKYVTTNMNRNSVSGAYGTSSVNDLFHAIYGRPTHLANQKAKRNSQSSSDIIK